jgi:hypothetical protein
MPLHPLGVMHGHAPRAGRLPLMGSFLMGPAFLVILLGAFAPVVVFMCWCEKRDWQPIYMRNKNLRPQPKRVE